MTAAGLDLLRETVKVRALLVESARESGELVPAADVEDVWTRTLQALRARLEQMPARVGKRAQAELGIPARLEAPLRRILEEELAAVLESVVGGTVGGARALFPAPDPSLAAPTP